MPLYDYTCSDCGDYRAWRAISAANEPVACPVCKQTGRRLLTATSLGRISSTTRRAHERNERSADRPLLASASGHQRPHASHANCNHGGGHFHGRPWMLGH